jgi:hypothetical protein
MLKYFVRSELKLLGRWARCGERQSNWKVDMANIDHCGTCAKSSQPKEYSLQDNSLEFFLVSAELSNSPPGIVKTTIGLNKK